MKGKRTKERAAARTDTGSVNGPVLSGQFNAPVMIDAAIPTPPLQPLHQLPSAPADFVGREEALRILSQAGTMGAAITAVRGMGGIGKTALALKAAEALSARYPDAQFYVDLRGSRDNPLLPAEALAQVIRAYYPAAKLPEAEGELRALYNSVLHGKRALVLLDDARDAEQAMPLLPPATCYLLAVSRRQFALPGLKPYDLDTLPEAEACKLLLEIAPRIGDHAVEIARLCGHLPLALRVAASAVQEHPTLAPADYVARLRDARRRLELVEASLALSFELMSERLQRLWPMLAVFPADFDRPAAAAVWGCSAEEAQEAADELVRLSMVGWSQTTQRLRLHDLARLFADSQLEASARAEAQQRHAERYETVLRQCNELYKKGGDGMPTGLSAADREWANILAGQAWAAATPERGAWLTSAYPDAGAYVLDMRLHPAERIRWLEAGLKAARAMGNRAAQGAHLGNLGSAYYALSDPRKVIEFYEQALKMDREIGDRRGEGNALGGLGMAYAALGDPRKAIEFYEQHLAIAREIGDRRGEGTALGNLGMAYAALGDPRKAIEFYEQHLAIAREIGDRRGEGSALGNLGNAYAALGDPRKAIEFYEQDLAIARQLGDRRGEGNTLGNLGVAYAGLGDPRKAIEFYEQHLAIAREIGDRRGEGSALGNLGLAYAALGDPRKAIEFHEQDLAIARQIGDRRGEAMACWNLGLRYEAMGGLRRAVKSMQVCVDYEREIGHPDAAKNAERVEALRRKLGEGIEDAK